jgi:MFS family permease
VAIRTKDLLSTPFAASYLALVVAGLLAMLLMSQMRFPAVAKASGPVVPGRSMMEIAKQPVFIVSTMGAALGYGVMNLLMAATPLAMQMCQLPFSDAALVLEWHVIGMFAPGFFTGHLIKRFGTLPIMLVGVLLNGLCILIALSGVELHQFLVALFLLGVGWNFLFTGATSLSLKAYLPQEKDRAQGAINFCVFAVMAVTSFASGALVTTQGWRQLNLGSLVPVVVLGVALTWLAVRGHAGRAEGRAGA